MKIIEAIELIIKETQATEVDPNKTLDQVVSGNPEKTLTGIVTTFMATVDVINEAIKKGTNLIITHEPTWFNGHDDHSWLGNDKVYQQKKELIETSGIVIWRFHDYMHLAKKDLIYQGFEYELGWEKFHLEGKPDSKNPLEKAGICYQVPATTLQDLLENLKDTLNMDVIRYIGSPNSRIERAGLLLGGSSLGLGDERNPMKLMKDQMLDTVICGDITEWTLAAYVRDAVMLGMNKSMIIIGHEKSEESGMNHLVPWIKSFIGNVDVTFVEAGEPFQYHYHKE